VQEATKKPKSLQTGYSQGKCGATQLRGARREVTTVLWRGNCSCLALVLSKGRGMWLDVGKNHAWREKGKGRPGEGEGGGVLIGA